MAKEIVKTETTAVANMTLANLGIEAEDIVMPKLLLLHDMSKLVKDQKKGSAGDLINSLSADKLGDTKTPVEVVVLSKKAFKTWTTKTKKGGKFVSITPHVLGVDKPREERLDGVDVLNYLTYNFYVLPTSVGDNFSFPFLVSYMSTAVRAGKILNSFLVELQGNGKPQYSRSMLIGCEATPNDAGQIYHRLTASLGKAQAQVSKNVKIWEAMVNKAPTDIKVHDTSDVESDEVVDEKNPQY